MKKFYLFAGFLLAAILATTSMHAQDWVEKMKDPNVNFFEVQKSFKKYYVKKDREIEREKKRIAKGKLRSESELDEMEVPGYFQYKRWEWFMQPRISATGQRFDPSIAWKEYKKYQEMYKTTMAGSWTLIGPTTSVPSNGGGAGRLNFVRVDPTNSQNIFVGSPAGGLWKSTDNGATWATNTDQIAQVIGCTDIAIDANNTNIMYLATGDGDAGDTYTVGLLRTTDGGATWNTTGLSFNTANYRQMSKVLIDPNNSSTILVATSAGIYRSTDGAATFTKVQVGSFKDMEFKPGDPTTIYACGAEFYRSTDNGQTWNLITSGLPVVTNVSRMAIAVTAADPNLVYMIVGLPAPNYGTEGFYKSTNSGVSWTSPSTPALGNQQWYDLCIAASPTNANEVLLGGQTDFLRSTNGGTTWSQNGGFTHVDYHDIIFTGPSTYFVTSDGGVFRTTTSGSGWTDLSDGLQISEMYGFGQSATDPNLLIQGWQDNGTNRYNGTSWTQIMGGDGMLCFIDYNNDQNMWAEFYNGSLMRSTNGGASFSPIGPNTTEVGAWVTPWIQDPVTPGTIWLGLINVWKGVGGGTAWAKVSNFSGTATINTIAVSPANNQIVWVSRAGGLQKSTNGGATWTAVTGMPSGTITGITCSNTDPDKVWITYSGYTNTNKVFQSIDQGVTWTNLSASIPNVPVNCITFVDNSNDALYIGTDIGVFYKDASLSVWQPFYNGLPKVIVTQLHIFYPTGMLRASTYGRGIWESPLYIPGTYAPVAAFGSDTKIACPGTAVQFTDYSAGQPTSWNWTFPGGIPSVSTAQNPVTYFNTPGTYPVTLSVVNTNGGDTVTYNNFITISSSPFSAPTGTDGVRCGPGVVNLSATGSGSGTLRWWDAPGGGNMLATGNSFSPNISASTNFYVDEDFPAGAIDYAGANGNVIGAGAFFTANDIRGLYFDVLTPLVLNTVDVYCNSDGDRTIEVLDAQGNTLIDTTIFIQAQPNSLQTITVNFTLYPGTDYFIKCRGLVDLYRNTSGAVYPYISTGINITGSNAGLPGYYYFFYNWVFTTFTCNTGRTQVTAWDTCSVQGVNDIAGGALLDIFPNPNNGEFSVKLTSKKASSYTLKVMNTLGQVIQQETMNSVVGETVKRMDIGRYGKGVYMVSLSDDDHEVIRELIVF